MAPSEFASAVAVAAAVAAAVASAVALLFAVVPRATRVSAALLMTGIVFASFAPRGSAWTRARASVAAAINLILLALWRDSDAHGRARTRVDAAEDKEDKTMSGGGGGDGDVLGWTRGLPKTLRSPRAPTPSAKPRALRYDFSTDAPDPEYLAARKRALESAARDSALKRLDAAASKDASIGYRMLLMPLVIGAAAIVPIVIASRMLAAEGFAEGDADADADAEAKARLVKALLVSIAASALAAVLVRTGHFVLAWVLCVSLLAIAW